MKTALLIVLTLLIAPASFAETSSFSRLMALGQSVECSFEKTDGSQKGTIYVAQQKLRGDFQVYESGSSYPMHMIRDAQRMYTWGGPMGEKQGMIMAANMQGAANSMGSSPVANMDEEMDFTCGPWAADSSKFDPPSDVQFQDMAQLMSSYIDMANAGIE